MPVGGLARKMKCLEVLENCRSVIRVCDSDEGVCFKQHISLYFTLLRDANSYKLFLGALRQCLDSQSKGGNHTTLTDRANDKNNHAMFFRTSSQKKINVFSQDG